MFEENPISTAAKLATPITKKSPSVVLQRISVTQKKLSIAKVRRDLLLPVEAVAKAHLSKEISHLEEQLKLLQEDFTAVFKYKNYSRLSFEPLTWRSSTGWPRVVPFILTEPEVSFEIEAQTRNGYSNEVNYVNKSKPSLPGIIAACYTDVVNRLKATAENKKNSLKVTATFTGVIPETTKIKIAQAQPHFPEGIFILAEVDKWSFTEKAPTKVDPLVVGLAARSFWIIDTFDLTPTEKYIQSEFTLG